MGVRRRVDEDWFGCGGRENGEPSLWFSNEGFDIAVEMRKRPSQGTYPYIYVLMSN